MEYCPKCGGLGKHDPNCNLFQELLFQQTGGKTGSDQKPEMLPVTTANVFCGFCNKVFAPEVKICWRCRRETSQIAESQLQDGVLLLSGLNAAKVWDPVI
jgi:hypothetical protein